MRWRARWEPGLRQRDLAAIRERDGRACVWCGETENLHVDHVFPWVRWGSNEPDNLQTLCRACNSWKSDFLVELVRARGQLVARRVPRQPRRR